MQNMTISLQLKHYRLLHTHPFIVKTCTTTKSAQNPEIFSDLSGRIHNGCSIRHKDTTHKEFTAWELIPFVVVSHSLSE